MGVRFSLIADLDRHFMSGVVREEGIVSLVIFIAFVITAPSSESRRIECLFIDRAIELRSEAICHIQAPSGGCFLFHNRAVTRISSQLRKTCGGNYAPVLIEFVTPFHIY